MAASETTEKRESEARVKAAAWAWYQRSGGSVTPTAGKSEVFTTRCATRLSTSRFQREAAARLRALASLASTASDSALTSFSSIDISSSLSHCTPSFGDATDPDERSNPDQILNSDQISNLDCNTHHETSLDLVALHPTACWDCGSSLFDSFELVAMSKTLDEELHEPNIDAELGLQDLHTGSGIYHEGLPQHQVLPLCNTPHNPVSRPRSPPRLFDSYDTYDTYDAFDKLLSVPDMQSKQAVYDMFCRYGDASKHVTKQTNKRAPVDTTCGGESGKHKPWSGLMSIHGIAKALHNIRHPSSHLGNGVHNHHHHHHPPFSPLQKALSMQANGAHTGASRVGEWFGYDDAIDKGRRKERHIHHHHHHHYHYLFHSDDDFRPQSLDKSLMVAAAGLRSPKVNHTLSSYLESPARTDFGMDCGRKWADVGSIPSPVGSNFQQ